MLACQDAQNGLSDISVSVADGKLSCAFTRDAVTNLVLPNDLGEATIDLDKVGYYVMLATGPMGDDGHIAPHKDQEISENPIKM